MPYQTQLFAAIENSRVSLVDNKQVTANANYTYNGVKYREIYLVTQGGPTTTDQFVLATDQTITVDDQNNSTFTDTGGGTHTIKLLAPLGTESPA